MSRGCLSLLPPHLAEVTGVGPRRGPVSRPGYEIADDAAGFAFPDGEYEPRVRTVEQLPRRRQNPLASFDAMDAVGKERARLELRALTIDRTLRRARSEPPGSLRLRTDMEFARRAFGVLIDVDTLGSRRRVCSPVCQSTRADLARWAIHFSNIDHVMSRKHFLAAADASSGQSPRLISQSAQLFHASIDDIDIDSHFGRKHFPMQPTSTDGDILPWASENWEMTLVPFPKSGNRCFFKQSKWSDQFGPLIASQIDRREHFQNPELQCLKDLEQGWNCMERASNRKVKPLTTETLTQILLAPQLPQECCSRTSSTIATPLMSATLMETPDGKATATTTASTPRDSARSEAADEKLSSIASQLLVADKVEPPRSFRRVIGSMISADDIELFKHDHLGRRLKGLMRAEMKNLQSYPRVRNSVGGFQRKKTHPIRKMTQP